MVEIIRQFIPQMTHDERIELLTVLKAAIARDLAQEGECELDHCPHCRCPTFVKKGKDRSGRQRWLCKGCGRTFSVVTRSILGASKLPAEIWYEFAICMVDAVSLRDAASRCGVCLRTSWFMRHRLCEMMPHLLEPFRTGTLCQIDSSYVAESFSGNRRSGKDPMLPRRSRRYGHEHLSRGISNQLICIMCGVSDVGDIFAEVCCRGRESAEDAHRVLHDKIEGAPLVISDMHRSYPIALKRLGVQRHVMVNPKDRSGGNIGMVDSMHSRLSAFLARFKGIATKHLQHYLDWFCYVEQFKRSGMDKREEVFRHAAEGRYNMTRREYIGLPNPFNAYWKMSTVV